MNKKIEILFSENQIKEKICELAKKINNDFFDKEIVLICILKGSVIFMTDLARKLSENVIFEFMDISSYQKGTVSSGNIVINKNLNCSIEGKHVIIVEDIIDTGRTLSYLIDNLKEKKPASLKLCTLLNKPSRRVIDIQVDYEGFSIPDAFVVGYGLDYEQKYRNLPYIGILHFDD